MVNLKKHTIPFMDFLRRVVGLDRLVGYASLIRIWSFLAGPITLLLIASRFSPELQGYYYTFNSLIGLTVFIELGLAWVIQQFASHEWVKLKLDGNGYITGDPDSLSRLSHLGQLAFRWYSLAGLVAAVALSIFGYIFFSTKPSEGIVWILPWILESILSGLSLALLPAWTLLDGCYQMSRTLPARLVFGILLSFVQWSAIYLGANLWTAPLMGIANITLGIGFLGWRYRNFFKSIFSPVGSAKLKWQQELWPMQWRVALSWLSNYFIFSFFTPLIFRLQGAVAAGQFGMTWSIATALFQISQSWLTTRAPLLSMNVARREFEALDKLFRKSILQSTSVYMIGSTAFLLGLVFINYIRHPFALRLLKPGTAFLFLSANVIYLFVNALGMYLRAHKKEPFFIPLLITGLMVGGASMIIGIWRGIIGIAWAYLIVLCVLLIPEIIVFIRCRQQWHSVGVK